jgi:peroxiredoxin
VQKLFDDYQSKGLQVIGATYKEKKDAVSFATKKGITYPIVNGDVAEKRLALDITGIPIIFLIDRKGNLLEYIVGDQGKAGDDFIREVVEKELENEK